MSEMRTARLTVLLVEDSAVNQTVFAAYLGRLGHASIVAPDGLAGVEAWRERAPDMVLMDLQMPRLDGAGAARAIRLEESRRGLARTPIVALTADDAPETRAACIAAGMDGHLAKPMTIAQLDAALRPFAAAIRVA